MFFVSSRWYHNCFGNPATGWGSDCNLYKCPTAISGIGVSPVTTVVCLACHFVLRRSPNSYPWSHRPPCTYMWDLVLKPSDAPPRDGTPPGGGGSTADPLRKNSDSSRQGSPPNDGVLVLRFRPIRRFWRIMSKIAFSTKSWKYHIVCVFDIPCFFVIPRLHRWSTFLQNSRTATTKLSTLVSAIGVLFSKFIFFMWMKKYFTHLSHRRSRRWDECVKYFLSTQKIFSCHDDEHSSRTYMKTFYISCVFHWLIVTPVMSRSQFLHPGGGVQKWKKTHTGPDGPGGVWKPPPGGPPPGGWRVSK